MDGADLSSLKGDHAVTTLTLSHSGMDDENSIRRPELITPQPGTAQTVADKKGTVLTDQLPPMSFRIYRVKK